MSSNNSSIEKGLHRRPFLFIVNPHSGHGKSIKLIPKIKAAAVGYPFEIALSESAAHAETLTKKAVAENYYSVVAVGGDGSVNSIGRHLVGSKTALGILPMGSGNGIARHFGISKRPSKALKQLLSATPQAVDTLMINHIPCLGFAGLGADAAVAHAFDNLQRRGFLNYIKLAVFMLPRYNPILLNIETADAKIQLKVLSAVIANVTQLGNNAYINPNGSAKDGIIELVALKPMSLIAMAAAALRLFTKTLHNSKHVSNIQSDQIRIKNNSKAPLQIDGEYVETIPDEISVTVKPRSLLVLTSKSDI